MTLAPAETSTLTEELAVYVAAHAATQASLTDAVSGSVVDAAGWLRVGDWNDRAAITAWAKLAATQTRAGQRQSTVAASAYWARLLTLILGRRTKTARLIDPSTSRAVPLEDVFGRVADYARWLDASRGPDTTPEQRLAYAREEVRRRLDRDVPDRARSLVEPVAPPGVLSRDEIVLRALERAGVVVDDSLATAARDQFGASVRASPARVTGFRRVVRPELSAGGSCGLCIVASDRVYSREDLLPLHARCRCTVAPVVGDAFGSGDPGDALNGMDLRDFYERAGGNTAARLKATRYRVVEHGELGPRLVAA